MQVETGRVGIILGRGGLGLLWYPRSQDRVGAFWAGHPFSCTDLSLEALAAPRGLEGQLLEAGPLGGCGRLSRAIGCLGSRPRFLYLPCLQLRFFQSEEFVSVLSKRPRSNPLMPFKVTRRLPGSLAGCRTPKLAPATCRNAHETRPISFEARNGCLG